MKRKFCLLLLFSILGAQASAVEFTNEVLNFGAGARPLGMGGAFVGLADDSASVFWNPAGLQSVKRSNVSLTQLGRKLDSFSLNAVESTYSFLTGAVPLGKFGTLGIGFLRFETGDIPIVSALPAAGAPPVIDGTFSTKDSAYLLSYGKKLHPALSLGITVKSLTGGTEGLTEAVSYSSLGLDLGFIFNLGGIHPSFKGLLFAANFQDSYNSGVKWSGSISEKIDPVDFNAKLGVALDTQFESLKKKGHKLRFAFDIDTKYKRNFLLHSGAEFWYAKTVALRTGLRRFANGIQSIEFSAGGSVRYAILQLDYAYVAFELTPMHFLTLSSRF